MADSRSKSAIQYRPVLRRRKEIASRNQHYAKRVVYHLNKIEPPRGLPMNMNREDLSIWALHFIHDRDPDTEPTFDEDEFYRYSGMPYHEDVDINGRFSDWRIVDEFGGLYPDSSALHVLLKIITDGHIRATWAFRNGGPTVYGPRAAVCFTEMPLYALIDYAKQRHDKMVTSYAIGLLKQELSSAGGRPVIYGLSGDYREKTTAQGGPRKPWPRKLDESCGISEAEQYRYVGMASPPDRIIDWTHEREWRWADHRDACSCPGLPVWLSEEPISFSRVLIVVPTTDEAELVLDRLKELYDAGENDFCFEFSQEVLEATSIVALDGLDLELDEYEKRSLRLEDIPVLQLQVFQSPEAPADLVGEARKALEEARRAGDAAAAEAHKTAPRSRDGTHVADVAGWAHVYITDAQTPLVSALLILDEIYSVPDSGYCLSRVGGLGWGNDQALKLAEAYADAAKRVLQCHFPDAAFTVRTRWD